MLNDPKNTFRALAKLLIVVSTFALSPGAMAIAATELYEAEVLVADRTDPVRSGAEVEALSLVLVKLSGRSDATASEVLQSSQVSVASLVEQFQYRGEEAEDEVDPLRLWVRFGAQAIDRLIDDAAIAIWPRTRPLTFILLGVDEGGARRVLAADDLGALPEAIRKAASARGLPIVQPLMDLGDRRAIGPTDVWGGFADRIVAAATRYRAEAIIHGTLNSVGAQTYDAQWTLLLGDERSNWSRSAVTTDELARLMVNSVADSMVAAFTPASGGAPGEAMEVVVHGIDSAGAYGATLSYLRSLDVVERIEVQGIGAGQATFTVHSRGGASALRRLIEIGNRLEQIRGAGGPQYRLNR
jgi:uncharacterized protein